MNWDTKTLHALVVEDTPPVQELTVRLLKALGIGRVSTAQDGKEGYRAYKEREPDIIFTDWKMPGMDGLEMLRKIRTDSDSPDRGVPVIMMTGFCSKERIATARDSGVTEFLVKPFSALEVTKRIAAVIKNPRDFVVTPHYVGPDRRRKREAPSGDEERRKEAPACSLPGNRCLRKEMAEAFLNPVLVERSQSILDNNSIDFIPLVARFLERLSVAVKTVKNKAEPRRHDLQNIIDEVMQIKANARIFKYDLVGDLAGIMLNFLEELNEIDDPVVQIIDAHQNTLGHLIQKRMSGDGGALGSALRKELSGACKRYMNTRIKRSKEKLEDPDSGES